MEERRNNGYEWMTHEHEAGDNRGVDGEFAGEMGPSYVGFDVLASL